MAPLIMVMLPTVSSFFSTCGCFLRVGRSSSRFLPPLSLACGWPLGVNGSPSCEWRRLQGHRGANRPWNWARPTVLGWPAQAHPGPARSPFLSRGSSCIYALCSIHLHHFDDVIFASKMEVLFSWVRSFTLQSSGMFLRSTSVLATIGSDFIKLMNTNKTP
jgi:hypothetical protein